MSSKTSSLLEVRELSVRFETHHGTVQAVDHISFDLDEGEILGLVGESGSGKSVTNLALMGLIPSPPGVVSAQGLNFDGAELLGKTPKQMQELRGDDMAMIFQDPMTSLNPLLTVGRQLTEVLEVHGKTATRKEARKLAAAGLDDVGVPEPEARLDQYPHELSGGLRQRVMIAMALLCKPKLLIADEPTTALDVTIQAQILELLKDLRKRHGTAIIFITHDLGVVAGTTDRVNVMYAGRIVESGATGKLFAEPMHPYTRGLLSSVPTLEGSPEEDLYSIPGQPPDLADLPAGCAYAPRCTWSVDRCEQERPKLERQLAETPRVAACFEVTRLLKETR